MLSMHEIAQGAVAQIPPSGRLNDDDRQTIQRHREELLALGPEVVQSFYDTVYGHPETAAVFREGERPAREGALAHWWERTVEGPLDDDYFAWMALVGLVHVTRHVTNPMMLAMSDHVAQLVSARVTSFDIPADERQRLIAAFARLMSTVRAIIAWGYDHAVSAALFEAAGMPEALLVRMRDQEIGSALGDARNSLKV
ncbi:MAG: protoglobin domain-containing protein [Propionibacteriaceae bacterium]|nr:protoglobin domain-containing protein [Propionibacteriaceae bacterium]